MRRKKKIIMRWSENETYEFVKLYFSHECLWNNEHEHYKLYNHRLKAYRNIVSEFNALTGILLTVSEIRGKIKNLRSTYSQELNKIKFRSGPHYTYEPTIKWFAYWHTRFQQLRHQKITNTISTFEELGDPDVENQKLWNGYEIGNVSDDANLHPLVSENENNFTLYLKSESEDSHLNQIDTYRPRTKQKKKVLSVSTDVSDDIKYSLDPKVNSVAEDEFDIYGKYIASQFRSMDLTKAIRLQLKIQNLIGNARLSDLSNK